MLKWIQVRLGKGAGEVVKGTGLLRDWGGGKSSHRDWRAGDRVRRDSLEHGGGGAEIKTADHRVHVVCWLLCHGAAIP